MRTRTMMSIWFVILLLLGTVLFSACGGGTSSPAPAATESAPAPANEGAPAIDAAALLEARCVDCHTLNKVTGARYTQEQWQQVVTQMIRHGAVLNSDEEAALVIYLAETYKP
jgi:hypothetical protein